MSSPGEPLRILHLASSERWTGVAEPATTLAMEQRAAGHSVEFACMKGHSFERRVREMGLPFVEGFLLNRTYKPGEIRADVRRLRQYVRDAQPDIIHCHLPHEHWIAALALRWPGFGSRRSGPVRPAIVRTLHRGKSLRSGLVYRWLSGKGTDMWIAVSQGDQRALIEWVGLPAPKVVWIRGAVDLDRFHPALPREPIRTECEIPEGARVAGIVARFQPGRGHDLFLDTIEHVVQAQAAACYLIAGRGELKKQILARIEAHPLKAHLRRLGYRKDDLPETYAAMDVALLLVPGSDGTCRAMLEAMACGRPVIGSRVGAIADTIEHGVSGWLVTPGDADALAHAIIEALADPERTRKMGEAARARVEQLHSRTAQCSATIDAYRAALARRAALK